MGCWNKTCGLSNLHISAGDEAYVFVLEKVEDADSHCYSTHLFKPLLLPFVTKYNDYGGGEDSSGVAFPIVMGAVAQHLHEMDAGENKYHDIAVKKEGFNEQVFFEAIHEGRLFRKGNFAEPVKLEMVMMRKDIVDHILENRVIEKYVGGNQGTIAHWGDSKDYIQYKFADIVADILPMIQEIAEKTSDDKDKFFMGLEYMFSHNHPNKAANWFRGDNYRYSRIVRVDDAVRVLLMDPTEENILKLEALLTEFLKGIYIDSFMEDTRKSWAPQGQEGSQSNEFDGHRLLIKAMTTVMDADEAYWREQNGEEEEESTDSAEVQNLISMGR